MDRKRPCSQEEQQASASKECEVPTTTPIPVAGEAVGQPPRKKRAFKTRAHYFVEGDIVWIHHKGYPYWPAEVIAASVAKNLVHAKLFHPPSALRERAAPKQEEKSGELIAKEEKDKEEQQVAVAGAISPQVSADDIVVACSAKKTFYFSHMPKPSEEHHCIEERLQRKTHDVSSYEDDFITAVREANALVRTVLDPNELKPYTVLPVGVVHSLMRTPVSAPRQPHTTTFEPQTAVIVMRRGLENALRDIAGFEYIWVVFQFNYALATAGAGGENGETAESEQREDEASAAAKSAAAAAEAEAKRAHLTKQQKFLGNYTQKYKDAQQQSSLGDGVHNLGRGAREGAERCAGFKTMIIPPRDTQLRGIFATRSPHRPNSIGLSCCRVVAVRGLELHIADHDLLHGTPVLDIKPYLPFCDAHPDANAGWVTELDANEKGGSDHKSEDTSYAVHRYYPTQRSK